MQLNDVLIESLLHQEEGPALDFKQSQYQFKKSATPQLTEERRSELVKDILAFANTKRNTAAYIMIGVEEVKGSRSKVVGVNEHLIDDELHDFMNRRTQRPVGFSYSPYHKDGVEIGVIEIPVQERLFYLTNTYGTLHENAVYVRDGSSTRTATPDEIAEMLAPKPPSFTLNWIDPISNKILRSPCTIHSLFLNPVLREEDIQPDGPPRLNPLSFSQYNSDYPPKLIIYTFCKSLYKPLSLRIHNRSEVTGKRIRFEGSIAKREKFAVMDAQPGFPEEYHDLISPVSIPEFYPADEVTMDLSEDNESWKIMVEFGNVRPDEQVSTSENLWFGSAHPESITMTGKILGENIPNPIPCSLHIEFETQKRPMTFEDVEHAKAQN